MRIRRLSFREIAYRKLNFSLAVLGVLMAVGCLVAATTLLRSHDLCTDRIMSVRQAATAEAMRALEDDYRKITKKLGFNLLILPRGQNLADLYAEDYASCTMPDSYVDKLANASIMSINHLLPTLQQKIVWPEHKRTVLLTGTRGEVPILHRDAKMPILQAVAPGQAVLGYELHTSLGLAVGDAITLMGEAFIVSKCLQQRGSKDDITIWIDLAQAQKLLDKPGLINGILALSCHCFGPRMPRIRTEVANILSDTQVIEFLSQAVTRAEARTRAAETAKQTEEAARVTRADLRRQREAFAGVLIPAVTVGSMVWVGLLALANVRSRRNEIGILRAVGVGSRRLFSLFLTKAILVGLAGGCLGYPIGFLVGAMLGGGPVNTRALFDPAVLVAVLVGAPLLAALATWLPAAIAAQQDPAVILRED
ncbi:MAG TPA: FtsX-like permease family protein [Phycisphaerae bacterium]|nr:FtsX-like permease family protein [Phycisphaerae bacterium]